ncbi:hypothetical protein [Actinomadura sp. 7K507]|uniref:hypothetical protein n=1 Tax=Actinomadura sp. 7K507 TaxID=2530365 RepID=UPI0010535FE6|nr:hypothetical protein [Actinomadura sp. 7K507]TDC80086.1 hypothetical protein E1285_35275 [Actinomadura sp. 7K507]
MKRGHVAALALTLALSLAGCSGSDDGAGDGSDGGATAGGPSASAAPSSGKGNTGSRTPPAQLEATKKFQECLRKQGVEIPSPDPTSSPPERDTKKIMTAMRECMKAVTASPTPG